MTADELARLNGVLAAATARRAEAGDDRDKSVIATELLRQAWAPPIGGLIDWLQTLQNRPE